MSGKRQIERGKKILNSTFLILCILCITTSVSGMCVSSIITLYTTQSFGVSLTVAGAVVGISTVASILIRPVLGPATNHVDKRTLVLIACGCSFFANIGLAYAPNVFFLKVFRFLSGIGSGMCNAATLAMVAECLPEDKVTQGVGYYSLAGVVISAVGPSMVLSISEALGYHNMFLIVAASCLLSLAISLGLPHSISVPGGFHMRDIRIREIVAPESVVPATVMLLFAIVNGVQASYIFSYAVSRGFASAGLYFTIQSVFCFGARLLTGQITNRRKYPFTTVMSGLLMTVFSLILGFGNSLACLYTAGAVFGLAYGTIVPVSQTICLSRPPEERRGSGSNTYGLFIDIAVGIGGSLGGFFADLYGYTTLFLLCIVPVAVAVLLSVLFCRYPVSPQAHTVWRDKKSGMKSK